MKQRLYQKNGTLSTGPPPKYLTPGIVSIVSFNDWNWCWIECTSSVATTSVRFCVKISVFCLIFLAMVKIPLVVARMLPIGRPFLSFLPEVRGLNDRKRNWKKRHRSSSSDTRLFRGLNERIEKLKEGIDLYTKMFLKKVRGLKDRKRNWKTRKL